MKKARNLLFAGLLLPALAFSQVAPADAGQDCKILCNADFDVTTPPITTVSLLNSSQISCWKTTASDGLIEVWGTGYNGVPAYSGPQFIEINATQSCTVYQDFTATPGATINVGFAHRGRAGVDQMQAEIGPVGGPYTNLGLYTDGTSWGYYTASYVVPASMGINYTIRFTSVSWSGGNPAIGNFLDAVSLCSEGGTPETPDCKVCERMKVEVPTLLMPDNTGNAQAFFNLVSGGRTISKIRITLLNFRTTPTSPDCVKCDLQNEDYGHITKVDYPIPGFNPTLMPYNTSVNPDYTNQVEFRTFSPRVIDDYVGLHLKFPQIDPSCTQIVEACFRIEMIDDECVVCDRVVCMSADSGNPDGGGKSLPAGSGRGLKVYPNPSSGSFTISTEKIGEGCSYQLLGAEGKQVRSGKIEGTALNIEGANLSPGTYTLFVFRGAESYIEKIVIMK
jgi:hypothetical protein